MPQKSLGLIETAGLAAGITAADCAVKSANVVLVGYELTKGGGYTVVKVEGDVGAVKAAIAAAAVEANKVGRVVSTKIIARPADALEMLTRNGDTVGYEPPKPPEPPKAPSGPKGEGPAPTSPAPKHATVKEKRAAKAAAKAPKAAKAPAKSAAPLPVEKKAAKAPAVPAAPVVPAVPKPPVPPAVKPEEDK